MKKALRFLFRAVMSFIIALVVLCAVLCFCEAPVPCAWVMPIVAREMPEGLSVSVDRVTFGLCGGLSVRGVRLQRREDMNPFHSVASASVVRYSILGGHVTIEGLVIPPPVSLEGSAAETPCESLRVLPTFPRVSVELVRPQLLGMVPERILFDVESVPDLLTFERIHIDWPDAEEAMFLDGHVVLDLRRQKAHGELAGTAKQAHIRPLLVAARLGSAVEYMDAFTEVPGRIPSRFGFQLNLPDDDLRFDVDLRPDMGRYNGAPFKRAEGKLRFHVLPHGTPKDFEHVIGPIAGVGLKDEDLEGTVWLNRSNGVQRVKAEVTSDLPLQHLMNVCGIKGDYVGEAAFGHAECRLDLAFPAGNTNGFKAVEGTGHIEVRNGQVMRAKGFSGLLALLAEKVPGFSILTDSTDASCDFTIRDGVLRTDNVYIEGTVFSLKLYGTLEMESGELDCTVRVQFAKRDSIVGRILQPITWPFTKLLLEFRLLGTSAKPQWRYLSVVERIIEVAK